MSKRKTTPWLVAVLLLVLPQTLLAGELFEGCGTLQVGPQGCTIFVPEIGGDFFVLENLGDFTTGDFVRVFGTVNPDSTICLPPGIPGIEDNTIESCPPEFFQGCGSLQVGPQGCTIFVPDLPGGGFFAIENTGPFFIGDFVFVAGLINPQSTICFPVVLPAIEDNLIAPCNPPEAFAGCGTLQIGPQGCPVFHGDDGSGFFIKNTGDFFFGDRVYVEGTVQVAWACPPLPPTPTLLDNTIEACFVECGTLVQGAECVLFAADAGGLFLLDDYGSFGVGDRVYVSGGLDEDCISPCVTPCISANTIEACFSECGEFGGVTQGCVLFLRDNGELLALENIDDIEFPFDERLYVSGLLAEQVFFCFPWPGPGVRDNLIGTCFSGCGRLVDEGGCVLLATADGGRYFVSNRGRFTVGDRIRVSGVRDDTCDVPCPLSEGCVFFNTVEDAAGDANCDGVVNVADLLLVIVDWGPCPAPPVPCLGDLTGDGVVSVPDLIEVLGSWSPDS